VSKWADILKAKAEAATQTPPLGGPTQARQAPAVPLLVFWRLPTGILLTSVLGPPELVEEASKRDHQGGSANKAVLRRHIPYGATAWSTTSAGPWLPVSDFPREWFS
jgi:hypothetical protein